MLIAQVHHTGKDGQRDAQHDQHRCYQGAFTQLPLLGRNLQHSGRCASAANGGNKRTQGSDKYEVEF